MHGPGAEKVRYSHLTVFADRLRFVGQSIVRFKALPSALIRPSWTHAVNTWAHKSKANLPVAAGNLDFLSDYRPGNLWSAYTQMIWDFSYLIGCGYSMYEDQETIGRFTQLYVCNYGPA